jgi:hypothetical protein
LECGIMRVILLQFRQPVVKPPTSFRIQITLGYLPGITAKGLFFLG